MLLSWNGASAIDSILRRSMFLLRGRQLGLQWCDRVEQIVISVYNIVFIIAIYVWINLPPSLLASLAQPSYLEDWVCLAVRDDCSAQHIKSGYTGQRLSWVYLSIAGSALEVRVYSGKTVDFHSSG
jgi:hypothetical protein